MVDNKRSDYLNSYDLDDTIQFTPEDIRKLRHPNRQPIDGDYFSEQLQDKKVNNIEREQGHDYNQFDEVEAYDDYNEMDVNDYRYENDDYQQLRESEQYVEREDSNENPFRYRPIQNKLREKYEAEKERKAQEARERRERLMKNFEDTYEPFYDENHLESLSHYNQFEEEDDDEEEELRYSRSKVNNFSFGQLFNQIKTSFKSGFSKVKKVEEYIEEDIEEIVEKFQNRQEEKDAHLVSESSEQKDEIIVEAAPIEEEFAETIVSDEAISHESEAEIEDAVEEESDIEPEDNAYLEGDAFDSYETVEELSEKVSQATQAYDEPILTDHVLEEMLGHDNIVVEDVAEEQVSFVRGTAWLTVGNFISRILGALYVIPWAAWLGSEYLNANGLYSIGYRSYALFLAISTAGFPSAIAKQLAYYHAQKEYRVADKLFKVSVYIMLAMGVVTSAIFFLIAPFIAANSSTDNPEAAVIVIRSLAPALLILPLMSILRGYFQGFNDMVPTAISQILEQIARIIYMLAATFAIMQMLNGNITTAVAHSTFAAFVGALIALLYLVVIYLRRLSAIKLLIASSADEIDVDMKESIKILVKDSIPFILLGSGIIIAQSVDQFSFKQILVSSSLMLESEISQLFGAMSLDVDKLIMIIISVAVGMSLSSIPLITSVYAQGEKEKTAQLVQKISILFLLVMLPASLGMASISNNMYQLFYANGHPQGPNLLITASILSIVLGAYTIISTVLQSMNFRRKAIKYLLIGLGVKVILQYPLVALFHGHGALLSTLFAFLASSTLMFLKVHRLVRINLKAMVPDIIIIGAASILMVVSASFWNATLDLAFGPVGRFMTFIKILVVVSLAAFSYIGILGLFGKLSILLGNRYAELQEKMRMF